MVRDTTFLERFRGLEPFGAMALLAERADALAEGLREANPLLLAERTGATFHAGDKDGGEFNLPLWGREVRLSFPGFDGYDTQSGQKLNEFERAMLVYTFALSDGTEPAGRWISFSELPDGNFYVRAFQGYTGQKLAAIFGNHVERFTQAAGRCSGLVLEGLREFGDHAFAFEALPRVPLAVVCWLGDEDFPPSYSILFDASASHHLTTDGCAILGSMLTGRLLKAATKD